MSEGQTGAETGQDRRFDGGGRRLVRVSEAYRLRLAHLFDPHLALHASLIEALPHQVIAVYQEMLTRQPLRFLLADDPGAGKTIMAGLLIREMIARGDVRRCLICAPGNLTEQWRTELRYKFQLDFPPLSRQMIEAADPENPFAVNNRMIARMDQLSRSPTLMKRLAATDWDLVVVDEAHKLSAAWYGKSPRKTKRYTLGETLSETSRHLLLLTATPHNGKDDDFDLFMRLLDPDRFAGRARGTIERGDVADLMRRTTKERLLAFTGEKLFPERRATSVDYPLSAQERALYDGVTAYARAEFNRVDQLEHGGRRSAIGFALTILQRRLASSPAAIAHSLRRRREKLEARLSEARAGADLSLAFPRLDIDLEHELSDAPESEIEAIESQLADHASAATTLAQLEDELARLRGLEQEARRLLQSGVDSKWRQLLALLQDEPEMRGADGERRKLVIFTEHRDTLEYLTDKLRTTLGRAEAVVTIHGGTTREARRKTEAAFRGDASAQILVATDAAGEGINLQSAHLMVNYDLPWNPNRLEQRFGRIHRIGQRHTCHLWNLVAGETREGAVYQRLLEKLGRERDRLNGQVFDVVGELFREVSLRRLLVEALRYGDRGETRQRLRTQIDRATDPERAREILRDDLLVTGVMDTRMVERVRAEMDRARARKLQPYFIAEFFAEAYGSLGGQLHQRERERYATNHVPAAIRQHSNTRGLGEIARAYERLCFDKARIYQDGKPDAEFICPGHPLLDALISLTLERGRDVLERGATLVDEGDPGEEPRLLAYLEGAIEAQNARLGRPPAVISRQATFVEITLDGGIREGGPAPYLDYRPATSDELAKIQAALESDPPPFAQLEDRALDYAESTLKGAHLRRVKTRRLELLDKTQRAVWKRLTREIHYWDGEATRLLERERAGKPDRRISSETARRRADTLHQRRQERMAEIQRERRIWAAAPRIWGRALIVPGGMLRGAAEQPAVDARTSEILAMRAVMAAERALGNKPTDVSARKLGYDIESVTDEGERRFIEVKGRRRGARDVTLTRNELYTAFNSRDQFILALVEIEGGEAGEPRYARGFPFQAPADYAVAVKVDLRTLLEASGAPS